MQQPVPPPEYRRWVVLLNGEQVLMRPIHPRDRRAFVAFFDRLGSETRFLRFHHAKPTLTEDEIRSYCDCDHDTTFVLVAEKPRSGSNDIVGVARWDRLPTADRAEVAFVVEDNEQGNGIGTHLLQELAAIARTHGLDTLVAETVTYNQIMLSLFRKYDPDLKLEVDGDSCRVTFRTRNNQ